MIGEELLSDVAMSNTVSDLKIFDAIMSSVMDPYDENTNPNGVFNLGVSVNKLQEKMLLEKLNSINEINKQDLDYCDPSGANLLKEQIARLINQRFHAHKPVSKEDMIVVNGCSSGIDMITSSVCNPGDGVLLATPYYSAYMGDVNLRAKADLYGVPVPIEEVQRPSQVQYYENVYSDMIDKKIKPKMLVICNPNNPLGKCYSKEAIEALLVFANERKLFVLMDEIYGLSVYRNNESSENGDEVYPFKSILSWENLSDFIDPSLIIVSHGMSKDFCLNGFRVGWIISPWNKRLMNALKSISPFSYQATLINSISTKFLQDEEFINELLDAVPRNLLGAYEKTTKYLKDHNIEYIPAQAGHFLWVNFKQQMLTWKNKNLKDGEQKVSSINEITFDDEIDMWIDTIKNGRAYYAPGAIFQSSEPGWIRIIFSQPWDALVVGLDRVINYLPSS
ncbi:hypothetical protein BB558_002214 [Smittium angustum]|uniref:Aminotransferase class I/classII large domain-containing protein n=1 Tax=Smittium angustum TaxID=133377 RepID=A0A2U1J9N1_SMIAN|nr:hypothetical protein BB558_002214 [Smittium angustum]